MTHAKIRWSVNTERQCYGQRSQAPFINNACGFAIVQLIDNQDPPGGLLKFVPRKEDLFLGCRFLAKPDSSAKPDPRSGAWRCIKHKFVPSMKLVNCNPPKQRWKHPIKRSSIIIMDTICANVIDHPPSQSFQTNHVFLPNRPFPNSKLTVSYWRYRHF